MPPSVIDQLKLMQAQAPKSQQDFGVPEGVDPRILQMLQARQDQQQAAAQVPYENGQRSLFQAGQGLGQALNQTFSPPPPQQAQQGPDPRQMAQQAYVKALQDGADPVAAQMAAVKTLAMAGVPGSAEKLAELQKALGENKNKEADTTEKLASADEKKAGKFAYEKSTDSNNRDVTQVFKDGVLVKTITGGRKVDMTTGTIGDDATGDKQTIMFDKNDPTGTYRKVGAPEAGPAHAEKGKSIEALKGKLTQVQSARAAIHAAADTLPDAMGLISSLAHKAALVSTPVIGAFGSNQDIAPVTTKARARVDAAGMVILPALLASGRATNAQIDSIKKILPQSGSMFHNSGEGLDLYSGVDDTLADGEAELRRQLAEISKGKISVPDSLPPLSKKLAAAQGPRGPGAPQNDGRVAKDAQGRRFKQVNGNMVPVE